MNSVMKEMVGRFIGILEWIDERSVNDEDKFHHHMGVEAREQQCINEWKKEAADQKENGSDETKHLEARSCKARLCRVLSDDCSSDLLSWKSCGQGTLELEQHSISTGKPWRSRSAVSFEGQE
jgi:hypothetical protein